MSVLIRYLLCDKLTVHENKDNKTAITKREGKNGMKTESAFETRTPGDNADLKKTKQNYLVFLLGQVVVISHVASKINKQKAACHGTVSGRCISDI